MGSITSDENDLRQLIPASVELQFGALRAEILKRMEFEHQLIALTLTGAGALLTIGLTTNGSDGSSLALLIYPLFAAFTAVGWLFNNLRISQLGYYIRTRYEERENEVGVGEQWENVGFGWETFLASTECEDITPLSKDWQVDLLSARGIFFGSQLAFLVIAVGHLLSLQDSISWLAFLLFIAALSFTVLTGFLLFSRAATGSVGLEKGVKHECHSER